MIRQVIDDLDRHGFTAFPRVGYQRIRDARAPRPRHQHHDCYELLYLHSGMQFRATNGSNYLLNGGQGLLIRPGWPHGTGNTPLYRGTAWWLHLRLPRSGRLLCLPADETAAIVAAFNDDRPPALQLPAQLNERFAAIATHARGRSTAGKRLQIRRALLDIVIAFAEAAPVLGTDQRPLPQVMSRVLADPAAFPTPAAVAAIAGCSLSRLRAIIKEATGAALGDWLLRVRLDHAGRLLIEQPERSITDIALSLGFSSSQYFATAFKRHSACTPRAFRALPASSRGRARLRKLGIIDD